MSSHSFSSALAPYLEGFLAMKVSLGYQEVSYLPALRELDAVCRDMGMTEAMLTQGMVDEWRKGMLDNGPGRIYRKWTTINHFAKYLCNAGVPSYVPRVPRMLGTGFVPRIFTEEEIANIFRAADGLRMGFFMPGCCMFSIPTLLRVLYATGMRVGEAVGLRNRDVDLGNGLIVVNATKNKWQRLVPITPSLDGILRQYVMHRDRMPIKGVSADDAPFFISNNGGGMVRRTVHWWFRKVLRQCGIPFIGGWKGPRLHDLRHTFAVHSLMRMVRQGMDMYCALPMLSTLLGHKDIGGTECYVRLTREMFPELNMQVGDISSWVFPSLDATNDTESEDEQEELPCPLP